MTKHSKRITLDIAPVRGPRRETASWQPDFKVPQEVESALKLTPVRACGMTIDMYDEDEAFLRAKEGGFLDQIPELADQIEAALTPIDQTLLINRLTVLGLAMAGNRTPDSARAWLHETARLLGDLPEEVALEAIDECVKEPGRIYLPSVGEIRAKAGKTFEKLRIQAVRLRRLADLLVVSDNREVAPRRPNPRMMG